MARFIGHQPGQGAYSVSFALHYRLGLVAGFGDTPCGYEVRDVKVGAIRLEGTTRPAQEVRSMADDKLQQKLADYVEDARAMEQNDLK